MTMKQNLITDIIQGMLPYLNNAQSKRLQEVLQSAFVNYEITENTGNMKESERNYVELFLSAKRIEGCSEKSLRYYKATIEAMLATLDKNVEYIVTDDIREYLTQYQQKNGLSKVTIDNIRRILSSFFSWLEDEDYILKNPVRRIHKVKTGINIKETYSDEALELMRDNCQELRDLAMIDMLASTGMRVGEMVLLNKNDIDFNERECIVFGKGSKERVVYFDARTKIHLQNYLDSRNDNNPALFVSLKAPYERLQIGGIETRLRKFGKQLGLHKVHPHKFRRTLATMAIDKGMPIEQLQQLLGHRKIDTTLQYAMVKQSNVTLFPELEHQLSYIKYANRNQVNPVTDFTKYEEDSVSAMQDIGTRQPELEQYIIDNFSEEFKEVVGIDDVKEVLNIIRMHFTADWYKRKRALSKIKMTITGYYFDKWQSKDNAKQKAEQIMTLLNQMVEDFIMSANERGD